MIRPAISFLLVTALALTLVPYPSPTHAQDEGSSDVFVLSAAALQAAMQNAISSNKQITIKVGQASFLEGDPDQPLIVGLRSTIERPNGPPLTLDLSYMPITLERGLRWDVVAWEVRAEDGTVMEEPPRIIAILIARLRRGWHQAFMSTLRDAVTARYPDGLPGRPLDILPYMEQENLAVRIEWGDGAGDAGQALSEMLPEGPALLEEEGIFYYVVSEPELNAALAGLTQRIPGLATLNATLGDIVCVKEIVMRGPDDEMRTVEVEYAPNPNFSGSDARPVPFFGPPETGAALNGYLKIEGIDGEFASDEEEALAEAAMQATNRALNRYLSAQIGFAEVTGVTLTDGSLRISVVPRQQ